MSLVERAKNIILTPKTEWAVVAGETTPDSQLITGYVLPLAAIAALAGFIGVSLIGTTIPFMGTMRVGIVWGLVGAIVALVMAVVMVYVMGFIIDALAPTFGAQKGMSGALRVAAYAYTPVWVLGVLKIIPVLGILVLLGVLYAFYLLYLGLMAVMRAPAEKAVGYTLVVIIVGIVVGVIIGWVVGMITAFGTIGGGMAGYGMGRHSPAVTFDKDSAMGKLDTFTKKMEEAGKNMEAAQKSGDVGKQQEAALAALGTAISGGGGVEPVQLDQLKPFVPDTFAGLPRTEMRTDRSGVKGLMVAKIEATYSDPNSGKVAHLEVTDSGGAAGFMGLAAWAQVQGEHEDNNRREVTRTQGDNIIHEEVSKTGGQNKFTVVVGKRFIVAATGTKVDIDTLKSGVSAVDLGKLASLK
jgi:Yip1-like protein